jgi:hypothetical protein
MAHKFLTGLTWALLALISTVQASAQIPLRSLYMNVWGYMTIGAWDVLGNSTGAGVPYSASFRLTYFDEPNRETPNSFRYSTGWRNPGEGLDLNFGRYGVSTPPHYGTGDIFGWNNESAWIPGDTDYFTISSSGGYSPQLSDVAISLSLLDNTGTAFGSPVFSPYDPALNDVSRWNNRQFFARGYKTGNSTASYFWFYGTVEGMSVVPEPSTISIGAVLCSTVLLLQYRQRRASKQ